jgi:hypothetical protein
VTRGRTPAILIGGLLTGLVAGILALVLCLPLLQAGARAKSEAITTQGSGAAADGPAQGYVEKPTFTIAVGIDDEPVEMPAIQSAMTDYLAFSDEFADRLEQGAVAQDFATHEHTMSPEAAREQVADGTSVLAVILPEDLSPTFVRQAAEYGRGERSDPPDPVTLTIVAGPQALAQDEFILSQYRSQVLTQASAAPSASSSRRVTAPSPRNSSSRPRARLARPAPQTPPAPKSRPAQTAPTRTQDRKRARPQSPSRPSGPTRWA